MKFDSALFLFRFLPIFLLCYYAVPAKLKNAVLFLGSLCFFAWSKPIYVLYMLGMVLQGWLFAIPIEKFRLKSLGRILLWCSVLFDGGLLGVLLLTDPILCEINRITGSAYDLLEITLPFGITVYTLQAISYLVDIYRGRVKARRNPLEYGVYLLLFPQLVAGPVVPYHTMDKALGNRRTDLGQIAGGAGRFCVGLAKKVLISDTLWELWGDVLQSAPGHVSAATAWLGILAVALRFYYFFSGYSDMAIGLAACLGFDHPENFDYPLLARSVTDFCRKWMSSLTHWLREYVYNPLTIKKDSALAVIAATWICCTLAAFWYGVDVNFLLMGVLLTALLLIEKAFLDKLLHEMSPLISWIYTTLAMALLWVMFVMPDLKSLRTYLGAMFGQNVAGLWDRRFLFLLLEYLPVLLMGVLLATPIFREMEQKLRSRKSGTAIATWRVLEKFIPATLFIFSVVWMVAKGA